MWSFVQFSRFADLCPEQRNSKNPLIEEYTFAYPRLCARRHGASGYDRVPGLGCPDPHPPAAHRRSRGAFRHNRRPILKHKTKNNWRPILSSGIGKGLFFD